MKPGDLVEVDVMAFSSQEDVIARDPRTGKVHRAKVVERLGPDVVRARVLSDDAPEAETPVYPAYVG